MSRRFWIIPNFLLLGCMLRASAVATAAQMAVELDRDTIYLGTQTLLVVSVTDPASHEWPVIEPVDGLQIARYGTPSRVQDLFSGTIRLNYRFLITPTKTGTFTIPAVSLSGDTESLTQGPFTLHVIEAALKHLSTELEPREIRVRENATLTVTYQGVRPGQTLSIPDIPDLTIQSTSPARVEVTRQEGLPVSIYQMNVTSAKLGTYEITGLALDGVPAASATLKVSPFVIVGTQVGEQSLVVGGQTLVHVAIRGLPQSAKVNLAAAEGLKIEPARQQFRGPPGAVVFSFEVTPTKPGSLTIATLELADGKQVALPEPIRLSVRQGGEQGILFCRGTARSQETIIGEPFIIDYEVFYRGDLQAAGIDLGQTEFAGRPHIKVEPVNDLSDPDWPARPMQIGFNGNEQATVFLGSGEFNNQQEQLLRFALRVTPLAAGELQLKGLRVILRMQVKEERRTANSFFSSVRPQDYAQTIDVPAHRVIDPPGKTQPPGYQGAVGTAFTYTTELDRTTATAMSPLTLTMRITGEGVGTHFKPPRLAEIPELIRDFDVSPTVGGGEVQGNTITFTQVVRPRSESVKEFPALPLVYYNYQTKEYSTAYSLPIPIAVTPGSLVGAAAMATGSASLPSASADQTAPPASAELVSLGANHTTLGELATTEPLNTSGVLAVLLAGPIGILAVWAGRRWHQRHRPAAAIRQQRKELLASLDSLARRQDFFVALADLVQSYLRLTFGLPPGELSATVLDRALGDGRATTDVRRGIEELLSRCDIGRFASGNIDDTEKDRLITQTRQLLLGLDRGAR